MYTGVSTDDAFDLYRCAVTARPLPLAATREARAVRTFATDDQSVVQFRPFDEVRCSCSSRPFCIVCGRVIQTAVFSIFQVKGELAEVQGASEQSTAVEDSFARMGYSREAEQAVNEQIK